MPLVALVLAALLIALDAPASAASPTDFTRLRGTVRLLTGEPAVGAAVYLEGTQTQTTTDASGRFELPAPRDARVVVVVYLPGAGALRHAATTAGPALDLDLVLDVAAAAEAITVSTPPPAAESATVATPLDVVRTPGTQADPFRYLRTLPGVVQVDEGAGLFVRGGDTSEVLVLLDGTPIAHPYRYETPTGGYFGFVDPFALRGIAFSAGGFPARFGNALSAVVELEGAEAPAARQTAVTAGLAGAATSLAFPDVAGFGIRLAANAAFPRLLFAVNRNGERFHRYPGGWDASLSLHRRTRHGPLKLFAMQQRDEVGVLLEGEGFTGALDSGTRQRLLLGRGEVEVGGWRVTAALGAGDYLRSTAAGVLDQELADSWAAGRLEATGRRGGGELRFGVDADWRQTALSGRVPARGGDLDGDGGVVTFTVDRDDHHAGLFADGSWSMGKLAAEAGLRADHFGAAAAWTLDPRLALAHPLAGGTARLAWGIYHQAPSSSYFDQERGAADLPPLSAEHWVAGWERGAPEAAYLRLDVYRKRYRRLPLEDPERGYTAGGHGWAEGVDLFAQRPFARGELRASYSFLAARRRWSPAEQRARFTLPAEAWEPDFSIPHSLQVVASWQATELVTLALSGRLASGRPFTPIVGAEPAGDGYLPIHGAINSARLPRYERLDLSASRPVEVAGRPVVLFGGLTNVLDRHNVFQYAYSADFTRRRPVENAAPRTVYVGFSILDLGR